MASNSRELSEQKQGEFFVVKGEYRTLSQWRAIKKDFITASVKHCMWKKIPQKTGTELTSWVGLAGVHVQPE
ncbi:MAG: hypothetical protein WC586_03120 [Methanoregula sp.]